MTRHGPASDTARSRLPATRHPCATTRSVHACDMATIRLGRGPRYGSTRATTQRCAHAWVQRAHSLGHGCVHYALDPVLTQCTVLSHCLDHCS